MRRPRNFIGPSGMGGMVALWGAPSLIKSVQRGIITIAGAALTGTATITAVDLTQCDFRYLGHTCNTNNVAQNAGNARVDVSGTTVTATRNTVDASTIAVSFEIVEYYPGVVKSVQRGIFAAATVTITAVNTVKTLVGPLGFSSTNAVANNNQTASLPSLDLTNSTTVTNASGGGGQITAGYQVLEFF